MYKIICLYVYHLFENQLKILWFYLISGFAYLAYISNLLTLILLFKMQRRM